jgi:PEGA domain-containing protein
MPRFLQMMALCLAVGLIAGCVERRMTIVSDPPGAAVTLNGHLIGATPVDVPSSLFEYYGNYDITLVADGYEPLTVRQPVPPPWYGYPFIDFFSENVVPYHYHDRRVFTYQLSAGKIVSPDELLKSANVGRARGQGIGVPAPISTTPPAETPPPVRLNTPVPENP